MNITFFLTLLTPVSCKVDRHSEKVNYPFNDNDDRDSEFWEYESPVGLSVGFYFKFWSFLAPKLKNLSYFGLPSSWSLSLGCHLNLEALLVLFLFDTELFDVSKSRMWFYHRMFCFPVSIFDWSNLAAGFATIPQKQPEEMDVSNLRAGGESIWPRMRLRMVLGFIGKCVLSLSQPWLYPKFYRSQRLAKSLTSLYFKDKV